MELDSGRTVEVVSFEPIVNPFCSPWRRPIYWWKMRHLRADWCELEARPGPLAATVTRQLEEAVVRGEDLGT